MGQIALSIGLTLLLTKVLYGKPPVIWRPIVGVAFATLLLAGTAQLLRLSKHELQVVCWARAVLISCLVVAALALRRMLTFTSEQNMNNMVIAIIASAVFVCGVFLLRRYNKPVTTVSNI